MKQIDRCRQCGAPLPSNNRVVKIMGKCAACLERNAQAASREWKHKQGGER